MADKNYMKQDDARGLGQILGPDRLDFLTFWIAEMKKGQIIGRPYPSRPCPPNWTKAVHSQIRICTENYPKSANAVQSTGLPCLLVGFEISNCRRDEPRFDEIRTDTTSEPSLGLRRMVRTVYENRLPQSGVVEAPSGWVEKDRQLFVSMLFVESRARAQAVCDSVTGGELRLSDISREHGAKFQEALDLVVAAIPQPYGKKHEALLKLSIATRAAIARVLEPALNEEAKSHPQNTYEEKKQLAKWINAETRRLGLALKAPKTGEPCFIVATTGNNPNVGRFVFDYIDDQGKRQHPMSSITLPALELMPADLSRVSHGTRSARR